MDALKICLALFLALKCDLPRRLHQLDLSTIQAALFSCSSSRPAEAFLVDADAEYISRLIAERAGSDGNSETQS